MNRRQFLAVSAAAAGAHLCHAASLFPKSSPRAYVAEIDRSRILAAAERYMAEQPVTITASTSPRSPGGPHDYFSEGDYWWPDPAHPGGPYIQRDGFSNPANFNAHREALIRLSVQTPTLVAGTRAMRAMPPTICEPGS
jgi:hypothetical protein